MPYDFWQIQQQNAHTRTMDAPVDAQVHDLLIITDATGSMTNYLRALNESLPKIISVSALTDAFARIGVIAYRDYCTQQVLEWSGWYGRDGDIDREHLLRFARGLVPRSGGVPGRYCDWQEAAKTGLAKAHSVIRPEAKTIVLLYADAPPHMLYNADRLTGEEQDTLKSLKYGASSWMFVDWVSACRTLSAAGAQVFSIIESPSYEIDTTLPYVFLAHETNGACFRIQRARVDLISKLSMDLLLAWMRVNKAGAAASEVESQLMTYKNMSTIKMVESEADALAIRYFLQADRKEESARDNLLQREINDADLGEDIFHTRSIPVRDFAKRYVEDESYRPIVVEQLRHIIRDDVSSIALNPVFGSLWRAVCNDRTNEARDGLLQEFGASLEKMTDAEQRAKMKTWLEESYDFAGEIATSIAEVPESEKFPCVLLDPTQDWKIPASEAESDDAGMPVSIASFTRPELLEIGRSCDYRILRRLGRVLTRLTYVDSAESIPAHLKDASEEEVPRIPLAMRKPEHKSIFWKILLHVVLPGTKLGARPAALLAALSIRMGIKPLMDAADFEMANWAGNWNNIEIPETWNTNCLALILEADKNFEARRKAGAISPDLPEGAVFLKSEDRQLFERLVQYSMLRANMDTTLTAKVGWQPEKSKVPIGPLVICTQCLLPRSVTVMAAGGVCGLCITDEKYYTNGHTKPEVILMNVSADDKEVSEATWVECSMLSCRAQYVVYDHESLRVRAKCHFCRAQSAAPAPWVECIRCLNRVIWPEEYRPIDRDLSKDFLCSACTAGRATIIEAETSPRVLGDENGREWLLRNEGKIQTPLGDMSLFKTISAAGIEDFAVKVEVLPESNVILRLRGKPIHNATEMKSSLANWIVSGRAEAGTCSLCFSNLKKRDLRPACGRSGCLQKICAGCQDQWYGINARGRLINVAALSCPFCRRTPAPRAVRSDVVFLGNLREAVAEAGSWIYAWCNDCGLAKQLMERVCANGAPPELSRWSCEECRANRPAATGAPEEVKIQVRHCPECDTATEKLEGCNHITCPCGTHWCFKCGAKSEDGTDSWVYQHMTEAHGGIYDWDEEELAEDEEE